MSQPHPQPPRPLVPRTVLHRHVRARDIPGLDDWWTRALSDRHQAGPMRHALFHALATGWEEGAIHGLHRCPDAVLAPKHWWALLNHCAHHPQNVNWVQAVSARVPKDLGMVWAMAQTAPVALDVLRHLITRGILPWLGRDGMLGVIQTVPALFKNERGPAWTNHWLPSVHTLPLTPQVMADPALATWLMSHPRRRSWAWEGLHATLYRAEVDKRLWQVSLGGSNQDRLHEAWEIWHQRAWSRMTDPGTTRQCLGLLEELESRGFDLDRAVLRVGSTHQVAITRELERRKKLAPSVRATVEAWHLARLVPSPAVRSNKAPRL